MVSRATLLGLSAGVVLGALATLAVQPFSALAQVQGAGQIGRWQLDAAENSVTPMAWRLDTVTGRMDYCIAGKPNPVCFGMPNPSN